MPLNRRLVLFAPAWLAGGAVRPASGQPSRIAGVSFDRTIQLDGQTLVLNGVGVRAVAWFKGYAAGLYMVRRSADPAEAMALAGPKRLQMRMLVDVPTEEFAKAFRKGVKRNVDPAAQPALAARMAQFDQNVMAVGEVKDGDVVNLDYLPSRGLVLSINGRAKGSPVPGADLYAALLAVFLGRRPTDDKLKAGLLGVAAS